MLTFLKKIWFEKHWLKKYGVKIALVLLIILPVASFALVSLSLFVYIYWPTTLSQIEFPQYDHTKNHLIVLAHGVKDDAESWSKSLKITLEENQYDGDILSIDWSHYAQHTLSCAVEGKRIGILLGRKLSENKSLRSIHLIGHSCGSFVIFGACESLRQKNPNQSLIIQTTYLDPVSIYGLSWDYGINHFGTCADYSETYIDTEDTIPGSNQLIPHTHTYDVTPVRKRSDYHDNPHLWPIAYYQQLVKDGTVPDLRFDKTLVTRKPAGILEVVQ